MPKLWTDTLETHRRELREAILDTAASLAAAGGVRAVTMSRIAADTGIGRATLYRYFSGVDEILDAWHQRQVHRHLERLTAVRDAVREPGERLRAVLATYAGILRRRARHEQGHAAGHELAAFLHRDGRTSAAEQRLRELVRDVLEEAMATGEVRGDSTPDELTAYCLHALEAARSLPSDDALGRLIRVVMAGLRPPD